MKPSKSLVYCLEAKRSKTLFETEKKAENFIKYNGSEIATGSGYAPVRAYYCAVCGGWHVTSKKEAKNLPDKTESVLEKFAKARQLKAEAREREKAVRKEWRDKREEVLSLEILHSPTMLADCLAGSVPVEVP